MKKQFLYNFILAGALGFTIQNAYAASSGSVDAVATVGDAQKRFTTLRAAVYEYHPDFNLATIAQAPAEKAEKFSALTLGLLDLGAAFLPRTLDLIEAYKDYFSLGFEQKFAIAEKMRSVFAGGDVPTELSSGLVRWINGITALTPAQNDALSALKRSCADLAHRAEGVETEEALNATVKLYITSALGGDASSLSRLEKFLASDSAVSKSTKADYAYCDIYCCFAERALSFGNVDEAFDHMQKARKENKLDYLVLSKSSLLASLMEKNPVKGEGLVDELYESYKNVNSLLNLYHAYKRIVVAKGEKPLEDKVLGNMRFKAMIYVKENSHDKTEFYRVVNEYKALGAEDLAAELCATNYVSLMKAGGYKSSYHADDLRRVVSAFSSMSDEGKGLGQLLQAVYDDEVRRYNHLREGAENGNVIALYGLQDTQLIQTDLTVSPWRDIADICQGYKVEYSSNYTVSSRSEHVSIPGAPKNIENELKRLAFWNTDDVMHIAAEAGMLAADGSFKTGFSLSKTSLESALKASLRRTISVAMEEVKTNPDQLHYWDRELSKLLYHVDAGKMPKWLQRFQTKVEEIKTASYPTNGSGEAAAGTGKA